MRPSLEVASAAESSDRRETVDDSVPPAFRTQSSGVPLFDGVLPAAAVSEREGAAKEASRWLDLLYDADLRTLLRVWLGPLEEWTRETAIQELDRQIVRVEGLLAGQLNEILHAPRFQRLEAAWRGLQYLVEQTPYDDALDTQPRLVQVRVLPVTVRELERDFERAEEFDQSALFKLIYTSEFGMAGGAPFGLLLGDYEIRPHSTEDNPSDDLAVVTGISQVAAAAFCPFVAGLSPAFLGLDRYSELAHTVSISDLWTPTNPKLLKWRMFRESEDSRFVGLALPNILLRRPYDATECGARATSFRFHEDVSDPDLGGLLWGNACWAFGEVVIRSFLQTRWFNELAGTGSDGSLPGFVRGLPAVSFGSDRGGLQNKRNTDLVIGEEFEQQLVELGFLPLSQCSATAESAFFAAPSLQKPKEYQSEDATSNSLLSTSIEVMLCVSRFAHYLKAIGREKLGSLQDASEIESFLHGWLQEHTSELRRLSPEDRADRPLAESRVSVMPVRGKTGSFACMLQLKPYFSLERMVASVSLKTELVRPGTESQ